MKGRKTPNFEMYYEKENMYLSITEAVKYLKEKGFDVSPYEVLSFALKTRSVIKEDDTYFIKKTIIDFIEKQLTIRKLRYNP